MVEDSKNKELKKPIVLKSNRVITAQVIRDLADVLTEELKTKTPNNLNYSELARRLLIDSRFSHILLGSIRSGLDEFYPRSKLNEKSPKQIADEIIVSRPWLLIPEKIKKAEELRAQNPGMSWRDIAKKVDLPLATLFGVAKKSGIPKLDVVEKTRRQKIGHKKSLDKKEQYSYFALPKVLLVAEVLKRNNFDRQKTIDELTPKFGITTDAILKAVFPIFWLDRYGLEKCVDDYKEWYESRPLANNQLNEIQKNIKQVLSILYSALVKDLTVRNKRLFFYVTYELLNGKTIPNIAEEYNLSALVIRGIKNKIQSYFLDYEIRTGIRLEPILKKTKFYDSSEKQIQLQDLEEYRDFRNKIAEILIGRQVGPVRGIHRGYILALAKRKTMRTNIKKFKLF